MALHEDAASVLEQFVQDSANLPAEISHLLEEIEAKDKVIQECKTAINSRDSSIQRHLKQNGCDAAYPKEEGYCKVVASSYDRIQVLQDEKVALSEKAATLLDRQLKRLDVQIKGLENSGVLTTDATFPSIIGSGRGSASSTGVSTPLLPTSGNAGSSLSASAMTNAAVARLIGTSQATPNRRDSSGSSLSTPTVSTPVASLARSAREGSTETKKRRLANEPKQSSGLRQSSLGPSSTPKSSSTPSQGRAGSAGPRSGSVSKGNKTIQGQNKRTGSSLNPALAVSGGSSAKKSTGGRRKGGGNNKKGGIQGLKPSPSDGDDSALSEVGDSENERGGTGAGGGEGGANSGKNSHLRNSHGTDGAGDIDMGGMEEEDEEEADGDNRKYCTCRSVSYGNMIACDNDDCEYEWFHWGCVGMTKEPAGKWYCEACKVKLGIK